MNPDSPVYRIAPIFIEPLIQQFPSDFPEQMHEDMRRAIPKIRQDYGLFQKTMYGGILYWLILRKRAWFRLTGNAISRVGVFYICFSRMMDLSIAEDQYFVNTACMYHKQFENAILKHNASLTQGKMEAIS